MIQQIAQFCDIATKINMLRVCKLFHCALCDDKDITMTRKVTQFVRRQKDDIGVNSHMSRRDCVFGLTRHVCAGSNEQYIKKIYDTIIQGKETVFRGCSICFTIMCADLLQYCKKYNIEATLNHDILREIFACIKEPYDTFDIVETSRKIMNKHAYEFGYKAYNHGEFSISFGANRLTLYGPIPSGMISNRSKWYKTNYVITCRHTVMCHPFDCIIADKDIVDVNKKIMELCPAKLRILLLLHDYKNDSVKPFCIYHETCPFIDDIMLKNMEEQLKQFI